MRSNVIILTSGLTGSSVLTGLISRAGYWTGDTTVKKRDYDTFENSELVKLNLKILEAVNFKEGYLTRFSPEVLSEIERLSKSMDLAAHRAFIEKCNRHKPWIWKDPRLWMTIHFWKDILDLKSCKFLVLTRNLRQLWVSTILRRQIVSYQSSRTFELHVTESAEKFLEQERLSYLKVRYEDIVLQPTLALAKLNAYLGAELTLDDLRSVYRKPLYKLPASSPKDFAKALLIYMKNYSQRVDV